MKKFLSKTRTNGCDDSPSTYVEDIVPVERMSWASGDLLVLQREFSEQVGHLEEQVMTDFEILRDKVKSRIQRHSQWIMSQQQVLLEKLNVDDVKCSTQGSATSALLSARQDVLVQETSLEDIDVPQRPSHAVEVRTAKSFPVDSMAVEAKASKPFPGDGMFVTDYERDQYGIHSYALAKGPRTSLPGEVPMPVKNDETFAIDDGEPQPTKSASTPYRKQMLNRAHSHVESIMHLGIAPSRGGNEKIRSKSTRFEAIEQSPSFNAFFACLLIINNFFIGLQVEYLAVNHSMMYPLVYVISDCIFTVLFLVELSVRMAAAESLRAYFTKEGDWHWNWFDLIAIAGGTLETCISLFSHAAQRTVTWVGSRGSSAARVLRVLRMFRVVRIIRVMRFFRSLRILISALCTTMKSGTWTAILMVMIIYFFGLVFCQATAHHLMSTESESETAVTDSLLWDLFGTFPRTLLTLFKSISGGIDWDMAVEALVDVSPFYVGAFTFYIAFMTFAVLNVVTGLFLNTAVEQAQSEMQDVVYQIRSERDKYANHLENLFQKLDRDGDNLVTLSEFETLMNEPSMQDFFAYLGLEVSDGWMLFRLLDNGETTFVNGDDFVDGCLRLRGQARSLDIAQIMHESKELRDQMSELQSYMKRHFEESKVVMPRPPAAVNAWARLDGNVKLEDMHIVG